MNYNDKKVSNYKMRKALRYLIMLFSIVTIVLSIFALIKKINMFYAIVAFIITTLLTKYRNGLVFIESKKNFTKNVSFCEKEFTKFGIVVILVNVVENIVLEIAR